MSKVSHAMKIMKDVDKILSDSTWSGKRARKATELLVKKRTGLSPETWRKLYGGEQPPKIAIHMTAAEWRKISFALSDVLCWHAGFHAGNRDGSANDPCDMPTLRTLNLRIKDLVP
jgi:hypothetical protein